jgi:hypothetical protein
VVPVPEHVAYTKTVYWTTPYARLIIYVSNTLEVNCRKLSAYSVMSEQLIHLSKQNNFILVQGTKYKFMNADNTIFSLSAFYLRH